MTALRARILGPPLQPPSLLHSSRSSPPGNGNDSSKPPAAMKPARDTAKGVAREEAPRRLVSVGFVQKRYEALCGLGETGRAEGR